MPSCFLTCFRLQKGWMEPLPCRQADDIQQLGSFFLCFVLVLTS